MQNRNFCILHECNFHSQTPHRAVVVFTGVSAETITWTKSKTLGQLIGYKFKYGKLCNSFWWLRVGKYLITIKGLIWLR